MGESKMTSEKFKTYPDRVAGVDVIKVFGDKAAKIDDGDTFVASVDYVEGHKVVILTPKKLPIKCPDCNWKTDSKVHLGYHRYIWHDYG